MAIDLEASDLEMQPRSEPRFHSQWPIKVAFLIHEFGLDRTHGSQSLHGYSMSNGSSLSIR
jgi:hypothetical protein